MKLKDINEWIENLSIGVGHGITNQMDGLYQMVTQPRATLQGLYALGQQAVTDPRAFGGMAVNALAETGRRATSGPMGFGEVLGENLSPSMFRRNPLARNELITYHSSPHRINNVDDANPMGKFDLSKIGTGEGAQAYGHGIYLSEDAVMNRNHYYKKFAHDPRASESAWLNGEELAPLAADWRQVDPSSFSARALDGVPAGLSGDGRAQYAIRAMRKQYPDAPLEFEDAVDEAARKVTANAVERRKGHFYTVDLPDEHIAKMLDWDAPLSEQPEAVRKAIEPILAEMPEPFKDRSGAAGYWAWIGGKREKFASLSEAKSAIEANYTGADLYSDLTRSKRDWAIAAGRNDITTLPAAQRLASEELGAFGIPGIKYFDGGSRSPTGPIVDRIQEIRDAAIRDLGTLGQAGVEQKYGAELARLQAELNAARTRNFVIFDGDYAKILKRE